MTDTIDPVALDKAARAINATAVRPQNWDDLPDNSSTKIICRCQASAAIRAYLAALPKGELD